MLKKIALLLAIFYSVVLATVSLIRLNNIPDIGVSFADKIFHFFAYCILTYLWFSAFLFSFKFRKKQAIIYAVIFSVLFGIVIEVLQGSMSNSRSLDVYDMVANSFGALIVSIILWFKNRLHVKNP